MKTIGFSKKVLATVATAVGAQLAAFVVSWIASGELDRTELASLVGAALTAGLGVAAGYYAPPNEVAIVDAIPAGSVTPEDAPAVEVPPPDKL